MATYLDGILEVHRRNASRDDRSFVELRDLAESVPSPASLRAALEQPGLSVIAEFKRRSPSKGLLNETVDLTKMVLDYVEGGASALSVLTDEEFFGGSTGDLVTARSCTSIPILRKDFTVDERDVCDAKIMGASAILLIVAALDDQELTTFSRLGADLGLDVLVEVHDEQELLRALRLDNPLLGINQRDLRSFDVDHDRVLKLIEMVPSSVVTVAESGITTNEQARVLAQAGVNGVLVGEMFMRSPDVVSAVESLSSLQARRRGTVVNR